ncbi:hypothetical protein KFE98_10910 [bacterium SCSIO 12741]|nr:hypothetical protein KFE98_10910 [bacterium SCSIO 12741]
MSFWEGIYFLSATAMLFLVTGRLRVVRNSSLSPRLVQLIYLVKVATGLVLAALYHYYYRNSDIHRYLSDGIIIGQVFFEDPLTYFKILLSVDMQSPEVQATLQNLNHWSRVHHYGLFNDNMTIVRFNALLYPFTGGNIAVHTAVVNFLSLFGIMGLIRAFEKNGIRNHQVLVALFLFPEVLLWSSGLLKEGLLFMAMGGYVFVFFQWIGRSFAWRYVLVFALSFALGLIIKPYVLLCMIPGSLTVVLNRAFPKLGLGKALVFVFVLGVAGLFLLDLVGIDVPNNIYQKQQDFLLLAPESGSFFQSFALEPNWTSLLLHAPEALWNTFSRPMPWNAHNLISWIPAIENLLVLVLLFLAVIFPSREIGKRKELLVFSVLFVLILFLVVGWVTPISGALVRYKVPGLPFLLVSLYLLVDQKRLQEGIRKILGK